MNHQHQPSPASSPFSPASLFSTPGFLSPPSPANTATIEKLSIISNKEQEEKKNPSPAWLLLFLGELGQEIHM
jgi:hypothetical protein